MQSYEDLYTAFDAIQLERDRAHSDEGRGRNALERYLHRRSGTRTRDGFARVQACREALDALDRKGWQRSFHQRMFHENFIRACARVFFKTEPQGAFARAHQTILDLNGWDNLSQEILISTPRRRAITQPPSTCRPITQPPSNCRPCPTRRRPRKAAIWGTSGCRSR